MASQEKKWAALLIVAVSILVVLIAQKTLRQVQTHEADAALARTKGTAQAKVRIVEYVDFQCPACANGADILRNLFKDHPYDVYFEVKYFPLPTVHQHALKAAAYAECAARQGKFWDFADKLMERQAQWKSLISAEPVFLQIADEARLDRKKMDRCILQPEVKQKILDDKQMGESLGVKSTPTYFVNGKMMVGTKSLTEELNEFFPPKAN